MQKTQAKLFTGIQIWLEGSWNPDDKATLPKRTLALLLCEDGELARTVSRTVKILSEVKENSDTIKFHLGEDLTWQYKEVRHMLSIDTAKAVIDFGLGNHIVTFQVATPIDADTTITLQMKSDPWILGKIKELENANAVA